MGYEVRSKVRLPIDPAEFAETVKRRNELTRIIVQNKKRRLGDVRVHNVLSRMQSCEQRDDSSEPLRGVKKKMHRKTGAGNREIV